VRDAPLGLSAGYAVKIGLELQVGGDGEIKIECRLLEFEVYGGGS
jgi:hypothetical protein